MNTQSFQKMVWEHYRTASRDLPWRRAEAGGHFDAYKILVSEIMLQQTQVPRVVPKYLAFVQRFPDVSSLARAPLSAVLSEWSGLGYNRRAKYLHEAAKQLESKPHPWRLGDLVACKGVGPNTAAAVIVYSYNRPLPFIETNIRTVFIHHFFNDQVAVADRDIQPLVEEALDREHPREFFWALMDYGTHLKASVGNAARASKQYARQSAFAGSRRQVRGQVLRHLGEQSTTLTQLAQTIVDTRLPAVVKDLQAEGLITAQGELLHLGS